MRRFTFFSSHSCLVALRAAALLLFSDLTLSPASADAYMAIVRQGAESAEVPNSLDHYGDRVATGDFNGDGYDDLAVAAPDENNDIGVGGDHGVVVVSYGSALGITHVGASVLSVGAPSDFIVRFGKGLAAGDFNGDGVDDLAVGIPGLDDIANDDIGSVWVYAGIDGVGISLAPYIQLYQDDCGASNEAGDQFGYTLAAGDMGGDGFDDLFVGSIGEDDDAGLVAFFPGSAGGVTPAGSGFAKQSSLGGTDDPGSLFGYSLAVGDFLDDGNLDLAVGAPYANEGSLLDMGKVYIVRGTAPGPVVTGGTMLTPLSLGIPFQLNRAFGWSLAAGHFFEAGGRHDLAIGEPLYSHTDAVTSGRVVVVEYDDTPATEMDPIVIDQSSIGEPINAGAAFGWSLAAGNMMTAFGMAGPDDYDDLAIGAPSDDVPVPGIAEALFWDNVGSVYLLPGVSNGFSITNRKVIDAQERNDLWFSFDEHMGRSLAFGKFDDTGWDNLAIGVPDKNYPAFIDPDTEKVEAGQVYVMAPWRQPADKPHRSSILYDCANRIHYAQRMGQRLTPASTTKALTALIAAEAIQSFEVNPDQLYTIPTWVASKVTGSQYGLFPGEQISFIDLVRTMIAVSGNDCAYAIGNILTGEDNVWDDDESTNWNLEHILADFADRMNLRAAQLGMSPAHHFTNPAGRPVGDHWTTAQDMAIFVDGAMENELFGEIVGTKTWPAVVRFIPANFIMPWLNLPPILVPVVDNVTNWFYDGIKDRDARAAGVKGGWNSPSMATGLYSAELDNGFAKATIFGVPPYGFLADLGRDFFSMIDSDCRPAPIDPSTFLPPTFANAHHLDIPVDDAEIFFTTVELDPQDPEDTCVEVLRNQVASPTACLSLAVSRATDLVLEATESRDFGASCSNNLRQLGLAVHNLSESVARLRVQVLTTGYDEIATIDPGQSWNLPDQPTPAGLPSSWAYVIDNLATLGELPLRVEELGYGVDLTLGEDRVLPPDFKLAVRRDGPFLTDSIQAAVRGCSATAGNTVDVSIHSVLIGTGVEDEGPLPVRSASSILALQNHPNPFNPRTVIAFELAREASVSLKVYDLAGRLVRVLETGREMAAGGHTLTWDGTDDTGRSVASGVYMARIEDGRSVHAKAMTLLK